MAIASMNLVTQKKSSKTKAPTGNIKDNGETGTDSDSDSSADDDDSTDSDSEDDLAKAAKKKKTSTELPASAFLYQKDLLYGSDHQSKHPFDHSNKSIVFVCEELCHHGFSFLMDDTKLDTYQLDLLMVISWETLSWH
jgi:hypothetical protein